MSNKKQEKKPTESKSYFRLEREASGYAIYKINGEVVTKISEPDAYAISISKLQRFIREDIGL